MVKISMSEGKANIEFSGKPMDVAIEIGAAVSGIYQGMYDVDEADAEVFRLCMRGYMRDGSPVWDRNHDMTMIVVDMDSKKSGTPADQS